MPIRGGNWNNATNAGVFALNLNNLRSNANGNIGFRPALPPKSDAVGLPGQRTVQGCKGSCFHAEFFNPAKNEGLVAGLAPWARNAESRGTEIRNENLKNGGNSVPIKNVFERIASFENILSAEHDVSAGGRYDREALTFWQNYEDNLHEIASAVRSLDFPPDRYRTFYVYEPKLRKIVCADYTTKVIQRAVYNVINPLICKGFITDTYSCIKGRGQIHAMRRLADWVNYISAKESKWYYLKMDVEKFFYRIDHEILMRIIRKKVKDEKAVRIMEHYICEASKAFGLPLGVKNPMEIPDDEMLWDVGVTIGGGLSHMYGNMYLDPLDQFAKRRLGIRYYIRYMDDIIILSESKEELHGYRREFSDFLGDILRLRLNSKTTVRPVAQSIEFVGFRIWPDCVALRKGTSLHMKRRLKDIQERYRNYDLSFEKANQTVQSYNALLNTCDCGALKKKIFDHLVLTHNPKEDYADGQ